MSSRKSFLAILLAALLVAIFFLGQHWWSYRNAPARDDLLALMPGDAGAILYADLSDLRRAPFVAQLMAWAPKPQTDADYAQFVRDTGFDYERDLDRIAIASYKKTQRSTLLAVAAGHFDKKKITAYAQRHGKAFTNTGSKPIFAIPMTDSSRVLFFTFLRGDEIAITDDEAGPETLRQITQPNSRRIEWQPRFDRLAGSPIFAVIQQDAATSETLAAQAPGGLRSPQLASLLNQLQWITIAGKPDATTLRVIAEGESSTDATARQLADILNGVIILAQSGLHDPKTRQQLAPELRLAYLELLNSAVVTRIDRNQTKSVRIMFDVTPNFLQAATPAAPASPAAPLRTQRPGKRTARN